MKLHFDPVRGGPSRRQTGVTARCRD